MASFCCKISPRDVYGDLFRKIAIGDRNRDFGDVANLRGKVRRHKVHAFGQVLPDARHFPNLCLTAQLAFGADFARHARHFRREDAQLFDHRVDDGRRAKEFAFEGTSVDFEANGLQ